jgi:DNA-binding transcriptional ArsR family regulator
MESVPPAKRERDDDDVELSWMQDLLDVSPTRVRVIRFASQSEQPFTARMVMDQLSVSRSSVGVHLSALTRAGLLTAENRKQERGHGVEVVWTWQQGVLASKLESIIRDLEGR